MLAYTLIPKDHLMALRKGKDHLRLSVKACPYFGHVRNQRARAISERDSDAKLKITRVRPYLLAPFVNYVYA